MSEVMTLLIVAWLAFFLAEQTPEYKAGKDAIKAIKECEANLPRDVKCGIIAARLEKQQ